jgi:hypothetical protein
VVRAVVDCESTALTLRDVVLCVKKRIIDFS